MRCFVVIYGGGTLLVASNLKTPTHPKLAKRLKDNGIERMILMEAPVELCRERYGEAMEDLCRFLGPEDFKVLDFNGANVFSRFSFKELGQPMLVEF